MLCFVLNLDHIKCKEFHPQVKKLLNDNDFRCKDKHEIYKVQTDSPKCLNVFYESFGNMFSKICGNGVGSLGEA